MQWLLLENRDGKRVRRFGRRRMISNGLLLNIILGISPRRLRLGLDTQVKYVENIDVVWKEEFRIDAAFEIENSTSIYSGLLRFAGV